MSFLIPTLRRFSTTANLMVKRLTKRSNPGLGHHITAIEEAADLIQSDPEGFGDLESDLMDAHKSHKQHESELKKQNAKIRQYIVEKKYFRKDPLPNFLTYAEKEQIKFLNSSDNEEWTVEKLTESFPASAETVCKLLKANWGPMSAKRILSHDASVFKNWERFKNGEYATQMSDELLKHLQKFADRSPEDLKILQNRTKALPKLQWQKPKSSEFSSIINLKTEENQKKRVFALSDREKPETINHQHTDDTYLLGKIQNKKLMTIKQLKCSLNQSSTDYGSYVNETGIIRKNSDSQNSTTLDYTEKFTTNEVILSEEDSKKYDLSSIKERIHIPRKLRREGATYRINDCYYDDDGEFLYRVPGMTSL